MEPNEARNHHPQRRTREVSERERYTAQPPITIHCRNCGEQIYKSLDRWYHLNTGGILCLIAQVDHADNESDVEANVD
jgi:hypothetical protein